MFKRITVIIIAFTLLSGCQFLEETYNEYVRGEQTDQEQKTEEKVEEKEEPEIEEEEKPELPNLILQYGDEGAEVTALIHNLEELGYDLSSKEKYDEELLWAISDLQHQVDK